MGPEASFIVSCRYSIHQVFVNFFFHLSSSQHSSAQTNFFAQLNFWYFFAELLWRAWRLFSWTATKNNDKWRNSDVSPSRWMRITMFANEDYMDIIRLNLLEIFLKLTMLTWRLPTCESKRNVKWWPEAIGYISTISGWWRYRPVHLYVKSCGAFKCTPYRRT